MNRKVPVLTLAGLSRSVNDRLIIDDFSYEFYSGRIYTILGPSGAGKSSLLRLINRLDEPSGGEMALAGLSDGECVPCVLRHRVGFLFQTAHLYPKTIRDNLVYAREDVTDGEIRSLLEVAAIEATMIDSPIDNLSSGEAQRVALARMLATNPEVVLLDEPTSALDPATSSVIETSIRRLAKDLGLCVIWVTHSPRQALGIGDETLLLVDGRLVEHGTPEQVINDPQSTEGLRYQNREMQ